MFKKKATLNERLTALDTAADLGAGFLTPSEHARLDAVAAAGAERRALSAEHTVVGFFGATGSGKTSLFNAVVGENIGKAAARRPTTSSPLAAVWEPEGSEELLNWLDVEDRRNRQGEFAPGAGPLILLDLPDFDSVEPIHREITTRLAGQVDVLVWVTDPEKYADSIIHDHFIRPHAAHSAVTLAVLNKSDMLKESDQRAVADSFAALLHEDGLKKVKVINTSARTGMGVDQLRTAIAKVAQAHSAQTKRIEADLVAATSPWAESKAPAEPPKQAKREMDNVLSQAAGADRLASATAAAYRKRLGQQTGWLLTSWMLRFRPDPLKRLGLREEADELGVHRTSMPELDASSKAIANRGVRGYASAISDGLPQAWSSAIADRAEDIIDELPAELDRTAAKTRLPAQPSKAWGIMTVIQWLALLAALVGVIWYLMVAFLPGALTPLLGDELVPEVEGWPIPTLLIMGGLLLGIVLGLLTAVFGGVIGANIKSRTKRALRKEVAETSQAKVVEPLGEIRSQYIDFLAAIRTAAGG
ncbi:50S ribosome-binding GTPase [Corynebacterium breve]|uniref:50S ribosome-binding GTPase n=1 Tax=Corynebacterium breve TaxID=3049799 RepID=A0ABY8VHJ7_9CORY|nr:GTPase [Corynebacterium breve]WIM68983.1 50S ribosome-binding GTPase [Corynebacterium breve]